MVSVSGGRGSMRVPAGLIMVVVKFILLTAVVLCIVPGLLSCGSEPESVPEEVAIEADSIIVGFGGGTDNLVLTKGTPEFESISHESLRIVRGRSGGGGADLTLEYVEQEKLEHKFVEIQFREPVIFKDNPRSPSVDRSVPISHVILLVTPEPAIFYSLPSRQSPWVATTSRYSFCYLERLVDDLR